MRIMKNMFTAALAGVLLVTSYSGFVSAINCPNSNTGHPQVARIDCNGNSCPPNDYTWSTIVCENQNEGFAVRYDSIATCRDGIWLFHNGSPNDPREFVCEKPCPALDTGRTDVRKIKNDLCNGGWCPPDDYDSSSIVCTKRFQGFFPRENTVAKCKHDGTWKFHIYLWSIDYVCEKGCPVQVNQDDYPYVNTVSDRSTCNGDYCPPADYNSDKIECKNNEYVLGYGAIATCAAGGVWSFNTEVMPVCQIEAECPEQLPVIVSRVESIDSYKCGDDGCVHGEYQRRQIVCQEGFVPRPGSRAKCLRSGIWLFTNGQNINKRICIKACSQMINNRLIREIDSWKCIKGSCPADKYSSDKIVCIKDRNFPLPKVNAKCNGVDGTWSFENNEGRPIREAMCITACPQMTPITGVKKIESLNECSNNFCGVDDYSWDKIVCWQNEYFAPSNVIAKCRENPDSYPTWDLEDTSGNTLNRVDCVIGCNGNDVNNHVKRIMSHLCHGNWCPRHIYTDEDIKCDFGFTTNDDVEVRCVEKSDGSGGSEWTDSTGLCA